jgi:hypothetical protein
MLPAPSSETHPIFRVVEGATDTNEACLSDLRAILASDREAVHAKGRFENETPLHVAAAEVRPKPLLLMLFCPGGRHFAMALS